MTINATSAAPLHGTPRSPAHPAAADAPASATPTAPDTAAPWCGLGSLAARRRDKGKAPMPELEMQPVNVPRPVDRPQPAESAEQLQTRMAAAREELGIARAQAVEIERRIAANVSKLDTQPELKGETSRLHRYLRDAKARVAQAEKQLKQVTEQAHAAALKASKNARSEPAETAAKPSGPTSDSRRQRAVLPKTPSPYEAGWMNSVPGAAAQRALNRQPSFGDWNAGTGNSTSQAPKPSPYAAGLMSFMPAADARRLLMAASEKFMRKATPSSASPYAAGHMSLPAGGAAGLPTTKIGQALGVAITNTSTSGPTRPMQAMARPKPTLAQFQVVPPESESALVALAMRYADRARQAAAGEVPEAELPARVRANGRRRSAQLRAALRQAKKAVSKAASAVSANVLGTSLPKPPTIHDAVRVGRGHAAPPARGMRGFLATQKQAMEVQQQRVVAGANLGAYHQRAGQRAIDAVQTLNAHAQSGTPALVDDYILRRQELADQVTVADAGVDEAAGIVEFQNELLTAAREMLDDAHAQGTETRERLNALQARLHQLNRDAALPGAPVSSAGAHDQERVTLEKAIAETRAEHEEAAAEIDSGQTQIALMENLVALADTAHDSANAALATAVQALAQHDDQGLEIAVELETANPLRTALDVAQAAQATLRTRAETAARDVQVAQAATRQVVRDAMDAMLASPPGFEGVDITPDLRDALRALKDRLLATQAKRASLAPDTVFELVIQSMARAHPRDPAAAVRALDGLRQAPMEQLLPSPQAGSSRQAVRVPPEAIALARELAALPRDVDLLRTACAPSDPPLDADRAQGVAVFLKASAELEQVDAADAVAIAWLEGASQAAVAIVHQSDPGAIRVRQTMAYNGVRNGLMTNAPDGQYQLVDETMRSVSEDMIHRARQAKTRFADWEGVAAPLLRLLPQVLPINKATPFNRAALTAASKSAVAVGIVSSAQEALDALFEAALGLVARIESGEASVAERLLLEAFSELNPSAGSTPDAPRGAPDLSALNQPMDDAMLARLEARFAAIELDQQPELAQLWARVVDERPQPLQMVKSLLDHALKGSPVEKDPVLTPIKKALTFAQGSLFMADPDIETPDDVADFCEAIAANLKLRDKLKITGGRIFGVSTAGLTESEKLAPLWGLSTRVDLRRTVQNDRVLDIQMGPQAIQLTIGGQRTGVWRAGVGTGIGIGSKSHGPVSVRPLDLDWRIASEVQTQTGVLLRVPRNKDTVKEDLEKFQAVVRDMVKWRDVVLPDGTAPRGPLEVVLALHPSASVNLLGTYVRSAVKREATVSAVALAGVPGLNFRAGITRGARNQTMTTNAAEQTGFFKFQEKKANVLGSRFVNGGIGVTVPLLATVSPKHGLAATGLSATKSVDTATRGVERTIRLTTENNVIAPPKSRYISEFADIDDFEKAVRQDWAGWVNQGVSYTQWPAGWTDALKHAAAEAELREFLEETRAGNSQFMAYSLVTALQPEVGPRLDGLQGLAELARRNDDADELARLQARMDEMLSDTASWGLRRLVVNERSNQTEQPGPTLGIVAQVSSVADASHNVLLFPKG